MGRKKRLDDRPKDAFVQVRCTQEWRDYVEKLAEGAGHPDIAKLIEDLVAREGKRQKKLPVPKR